jgi:hypothetical protein
MGCYNVIDSIDARRKEIMDDIEERLIKALVDTDKNEEFIKYLAEMLEWFDTATGWKFVPRVPQTKLHKLIEHKLLKLTYEDKWDTLYNLIGNTDKLVSDESLAVILKYVWARLDDIDSNICEDFLEYLKDSYSDRRILM